MDVESDLSLDYEREVLNATWEGFVIWAVNQDLTTQEEVKTMGISERASFADKHWVNYIEDLQYDYMENMDFQKTKYEEAI